MKQYDKPLFHKAIPGIYADEVACFPDDSMPNQHLHAGTELYFLLDGERYYFVEQEAFLLKSRMAILIRPHQIHKTHTSNHRGHYRMLYQLSDSVFDLFARASDCDDFIAKPCIVVEFSEDDWENVLATIERLNAAIDQASENDYAMSRLIAAELLSLFAQAYQKQMIAPQKQSFSDRVVHDSKYELALEIMTYIQVHCADKCSLDDIAENCHVSRAYLTRVFKFITGFTVKEYQTVCRIRNAKALLTTTNLTVTEIVNQTGFSNIAKFEKKFKSATSMTPLQYRKQERKNLP